MRFSWPLTSVILISYIAEHTWSWNCCRQHGFSAVAFMCWHTSSSPTDESRKVNTGQVSRRWSGRCVRARAFSLTSKRYYRCFHLFSYFLQMKPVFTEVLHLADTWEMIDLPRRWNCCCRSIVNVVYVTSDYQRLHQSPHPGYYYIL